MKYCPRCNGPMIVMERNIQPNSTQTWYECTTCSSQRLLSAERPRYVAGSGQSLTSRFQAEGPEATTEAYPHGQISFLR